MIGRAVTSRLEKMGHSLILPSRQIFKGLETNSWLDLKDNLESIFSSYPDYVLNFAGLVRQKILSDSDETEAIRINSIYPRLLDEMCSKKHVKLISVGTDCVYSGSLGKYNEKAAQDGIGSYAFSKILGEMGLQQQMTIRTSVVGISGGRGGKSLFDWLINQPKGATIQGYMNHHWNGTSNLTLAKILEGVISNQLHVPGKFHLVPRDSMTKFQLLELGCEVLSRPDLRVVPQEEDVVVDRTLSTEWPEMNSELWRGGGFGKIPSVEETVRQLDLNY